MDDASDNEKGFIVKTIRYLTTGPANDLCTGVSRDLPGGIDQGYTYSGDTRYSRGCTEMIDHKRLGICNSCGRDRENSLKKQSRGLLLTPERSRTKKQRLQSPSSTNLRINYRFRPREFMSNLVKCLGRERKFFEKQMEKKIECDELTDKKLQHLMDDLSKFPSDVDEVFDLMIHMVVEKELTRSKFDREEIENFKDIMAAKSTDFLRSK